MTDWIEREVYEVVPLSALPLPEGMRDPACMAAPKARLLRRLRRTAPRLVPRQGPRDCCFDHRVDWRKAAETAVRLVRQAHREGLDGEDARDYVRDRVRDEGLGERERKAVTLRLLGPGVQLHEDGAPVAYMDGRHRVAAQIDQGVEETLVYRVDLLDPATGQPAGD